ncbi:hypothetical protein, partial [Leptospira noguchii]|uniref:hypothetical protein n=1 Tax=Leptospira noguchii TaxID=28182 RepID=UPI001F2A2933
KTTDKQLYVASSRPIRQNFRISKQPTNNSMSLQVTPSGKILVFQNNRQTTLCVASSRSIRQN